jgi:hypothetical protein
VLQGQSPLDALRSWKENDIATPVVHSHSFANAIPYLEVLLPRPDTACNRATSLGTGSALHGKESTNRKRNWAVL